MDRLLSERKGDAQILDALAQAALARIPTETERLFALTNVAKNHNRREAWLGVVQALTSTAEFRTHAQALHRRAAK